MGLNIPVTHALPEEPSWLRHLFIARFFGERCVG